MYTRKRRGGAKLLGVGAVCAFVGLALAVAPAFASASPTLRSPVGPGGIAKVVGVGAHVIGKSSTIKFVHSNGTFTCSNITLDQTVTGNPPAALSGTGSASGCLANGAVPIEFTAFTVTMGFEADGIGTGTIAYTWNMPLAGYANCHFEGPINMSWTDGSANVNVIESVLVGSGAGCPPSAVLSGAISLETSAGAPVTVNNE